MNGIFKPIKQIINKTNVYNNYGIQLGIKYVKMYIKKFNIKNMIKI